MGQHLSLTVTFIVCAINVIGPRGHLNYREHGVLYWEEGTKLENKEIHKQTKGMLSVCISGSAYAKIDGMCLG